MKKLDEAIHGSMARAQQRCASGRCGTRPFGVDDTIEYVVLLPDGSFSEPSSSLHDIMALAKATGGAARARRKRT